MSNNTLYQQCKAYIPFIKYCIVGVAGTTVDVVILWMCVELLVLAVIPSSVIAFTAAVIHNYILNKLWTFKVKSTNHRKLFIKFFLVSGVGLGLTVACMYLFTNIFDIWYIAAKLITSGLVLSWNFLANKYWTFNLQTTELTYDKAQYDLSIVIPAFNEEKRIQSTLESVRTFCKTGQYSVEVLIVDDGSTDETKNIVSNAIQDFDNSRIIHYSDNQGKGYAVMRGVEESRGACILFMDADHSTPITEIHKLLPVIHSKKYDVVIGSRYIHSDSVKIEQPLLRQYIGSIGNRIIQLFLIDGIRDTQCGFKLFTRDAAMAIFSRQKVKRWGFDMEALLLAQLLGYKVAEIPVDWYHAEGSRFRPIRSAITTFWELIYIKLNEWSGRYE